MLHNQHINVKVTIITVVRNAVGKIEPTISSVLGQKYDNIEYIIIDGNSIDGTQDVINRYRSRITHFISEPDHGIYDALNKGVLLASGDWIGVMNAGDQFASADVLSRIFSTPNAYNGIDVIYGNAIEVDGNYERFSQGSEDLSDLQKGPPYRHGASFVRNSTHKRYLFDLSKSSILGFALDYEQIFRMYKGQCVFKKVAVTIIRYELRGASTTSPFNVTYYNYLITHNMRCGLGMKLILTWLTAWRGIIAIIKRLLTKHKAPSRLFACGSVS